MQSTDKDAKRRYRAIGFWFVAPILLVATVAFGAFSANAAKADITFQISPASQSIERGKTTTYTVTLTSAGGFAGSVALSASGLPNGATASLTPSALTLAASGAGATATSILSVSTTASTPVGSSTIKVTGTNAKVSGSITAGLTVNAPQSGALSMTAIPATVSAAPGETAAYTIQLVRTSLPGNVTLTVISGLPKDATGVFAPSPTTGNTSTLQVTTPVTTNDGTYTLILGASGLDGNGVTRTASASVKLDINTKGKTFSISGDLVGLLAPGRTLPLGLSLTNPNSKVVSVTNLSVSLASVTKANGASGSCTIADYAVVQYSGPYPLVLPGSSTKTLSSLGVTLGQWPQIQLLNRSVNQDACKGATLHMSYSGSGQGN